MPNEQETVFDGDMELKKRQHDITVVGTTESDEEEEDTEDPVNDEVVQASALPSVIPILEVSAKSRKSYPSLAVAILLVSVISSVGEQQLLKDVFSENFNAPFFILYVGNVLRLCTLPIYIMMAWTFSRGRKPHSTLPFIMKNTLIFQSKDACPIYFIKTIGIMASFIVLAVSLGVMALSHATVSECAAVGTTQVAMVYFIAVVFLHHQVLLVKVFAVVVSLSGVGLIAYAKGFQSNSAVGIGLTLIATMCFSFNINYYKQMYKKMSFGQCCCFVTSCSTFILLVFWWLPLWTHQTGVEIWEWNTVPWTLLLSSAGCTWLSAMCMNYGLIVGTPLLMSFGSLLRIPVNIVIDVCIRKVEFTELEMAGSALIVIGFLIIIVPDKRISLKLKPLLISLKK